VVPTEQIDEDPVQSVPDAASLPMPASFTLAPVAPSEKGQLNILLMGVDARQGQSIDVGVRPDSLSVLHLDPETGSCRILAIPRDTRTELPGYGQSKVNHALAVGGVPYEILVVEQLLGIQIDHYGLIDFAGIQGLVDAVGGVTVDNPVAFNHLGFSFAAGDITLNGEQALVYARYRYDNRGDFGRIERQQQVIRAIIDQASGMDVVQSANSLLNNLEDHFKTDLSPTDLIGLATQYRSSCTAETLQVGHLNGDVATFMDPLLNMNLSYVIVSDDEIAARVEWLLYGD
jgi:LCP family protein required for cell wall assembly